MNSKRYRVISCALSFLIGLIAASVATTFAADIQWSDGEGGNGAYSPAAWTNLQQAITSAENNPATMGQVKVSGDLTRPNGETVVGDLEIRAGGVTVSGGWDPTFTTQTGRSVLNANLANDATNRYRVFRIVGTNAVVSDFVVTRGGRDWLRPAGTRRQRDLRVRDQRHAPEHHRDQQHLL